jgi:hypothetical protein
MEKFSRKPAAKNSDEKQENGKTKKQSLHHAVFSNKSHVTLQKKPLAPHTLLFTFAREREDRERHTHTRTHVVWSDYASAEETHGGERFVGFDRQ